MADSFRFPFRRGVNYLGTYSATGRGNALPVLEDMQFEAASLPGISGTMAVQEAGSDSFSASGTVADAGVTGSLAAQESGADTFTASGSVAVSGSLSAQEAGSDAFAASGAVAISGAFSAQEAGSDAFAASGSVRVSGALSAQESGSDQFVGTGSLPIAGALVAQETGEDVFAATGSATGAGVSGSLVAQESGEDTFAAVATIGKGGGPALGGDEYQKRKRRQEQQELLALALIRHAQERIATRAKEPEQRIEAAKEALEIISPVVEQDDAETYSELLARIAELEAAIADQARWQNQMAAIRLIGEVGPFLNTLKLRRMDDEEAAIMTLLLAA